MKGEFYKDKKNTISKLISELKYDEAMEIINEELKMPYIPIEFESFLKEAINQIPLMNSEKLFSLSLEKIIDLLIKFDQDSFSINLIQNLSKFNLENYKDEIIYLFENSKNKRNKAMVYELLINNKINIELPFGNPKNSSSFKKNEHYKLDINNLSKKLINFPALSEISIDILNDIYLTKHLGFEIKNEYCDVVLFVISRIFKENKILELIDDISIVQKKLNSLKTFDNI
ncbi:MAG: hypothetical protein TYPL_1160 [Candidatus Tyloplasma litorale]|nr:MAG: hypothetical protein TYPL_1160 [Mycoplasmatales bacterium]